MSRMYVTFAGVQSQPLAARGDMARRPENIRDVPLAQRTALYGLDQQGLARTLNGDVVLPDVELIKSSPRVGMSQNAKIAIGVGMLVLAYVMMGHK